MLEAIRISKSYRSGGMSQAVFSGLDLQVGSGEVVALLGASGSGKTTLLNLLSGIDTPDSGRVLLDGTEVHRLAEPARTILRRNRIGFVFQFFNLIPTLTVAENIALPMELVGQDPARVRERLAQLLAEVDLADKAERYPDTLSGGEQQRVAVARALAHGPSLLLADEPTGNLDEQTGRRIVALLTALARGQGASLLIVTHSSQVAAAADRVLQLQDGRLAPA